MDFLFFFRAFRVFRGHQNLQSPDPDFYKGIPEYEMLKRGMTHEERVQNGYWVAYKIVEEFEKRCISKISG